MSKEEQQSPEKVLNDLYSFVYGDENKDERSIEKARKNVKSSGIDITKILKFADEQSERLKKKSKLEMARAKRLEIENGIVRSISGAYEGLRGEVELMIRELAAINLNQAQVYFNRFKKCNDEDLESLKQDLQLLESLDEENE